MYQQENAASSYDVVYSDLEIDQYTYDFWNLPLPVNNAEFALAKHPNRYYPDNGQAASFAGTSYIVQSVGDVTTNSVNLLVDLAFRTLNSDGVLMAMYEDVTSTQLILYLNEGRVHVEVRSGSGIADAVESEG